ncbi:hypothetical protein DM860_015760 [Cuscuta australis]|uniref:Uncharacterized protein n=1 Tax=Cuscuta australis TaxID=267555 RepID=A0A328DVA1_9ASTE|nr:hypothetical protein DM860_015760 [Cuscuta australis]
MAKDPPTTTLESATAPLNDVWLAVQELALEIHTLRQEQIDLSQRVENIFQRGSIRLWVFATILGCIEQTKDEWLPEQVDKSKLIVAAHETGTLMPADTYGHVEDDSSPTYYLL